MELKPLASAVAKYAPLLASVISEANPIAGLIIMAIAKAFNSSSDPQELLNSLNTNPNTALKLQQLEVEHEDALLQNQTEDRISARQREEKIIQLTGRRDYILDILAIMVISGFFVLCFINYYIKLPDDHILAMLIGQLSSGFMLCLSYYFGSSNK